MEQIPSNEPVMESKPGPAGWLQIWIKAITKPNEQTFIDITEQAGATTRTALLWVFIAGTISGLFQAVLQTIYRATGTTPRLPIPGLEQYVPSGGGEPSSVGLTLIISLCAAPIGGLVSVAFFALGTAIIQWIAKLFGGAGTFEKLAYAVAAITIPFTLVSSVLGLFTAIPYVGICFAILSLGASLYVIVLQVIAIKGVNRFGWGPAIGSTLIPGLVILFVCGCIVIGGLTLLGPTIGNVFSEINQSLAP